MSSFNFKKIEFVLPLGQSSAGSLDQISFTLQNLGHCPTNIDSETLGLDFDGRQYRFLTAGHSLDVLMIADIFTGTSEELVALAPALLHANYQSQLLGLAEFGEGNQQEGPISLPVLGLDLERQMIVMSLVILERHIKQNDFPELLDGLIKTIHRDATSLVEQLRSQML